MLAHLLANLIQSNLKMFFQKSPLVLLFFRGNKDGEDHFCHFYV